MIGFLGTVLWKLIWRFLGGALESLPLKQIYGACCRRSRRFAQHRCQQVELHELENCSDYDGSRPKDVDPPGSLQARVAAAVAFSPRTSTRLGKRLRRRCHSQSELLLLTWCVLLQPFLRNFASLKRIVANQPALAGQVGKQQRRAQQCRHQVWTFPLLMRSEIALEANQALEGTSALSSAP